MIVKNEEILLPMKCRKIGAIEYYVTDLLRLNEKAATVIELITAVIINREGVSQVTFDVSVFDKKAEVIADIVLDYGYKIRKRGRNGFQINGRLLSCGYHYRPEEHKIYFDLIPETAEIIHGMQGKGDTFDLIAEIGRRVYGI